MTNSADPTPIRQAEAESQTTDDTAGIAAYFGRTEEADPWKKYDEPFRALEAARGDQFERFIQRVLVPNGRADGTLTNYRRAFRYWQEHSNSVGRHPACPAPSHVESYIHTRLEEGNKVRTVKLELIYIARALRFFQTRPEYPQGSDFDPVKTAVEDYPWPDDDELSVRILPMEEVQRGVARVTDVRDRAMLVCQFKWGMRAGEVRNLQLQDIALSNETLHGHYPELGTHPGLRDDDGKPLDNAVIIPPRTERSGNKSLRARILPIDAETRKVLIRWLLVRPDDGEPWVFLSRTNHEQLRDKTAIVKAWKTAFPRSEYDDTDKWKRITPHYGRHYFANHFRFSVRMPRELIQYMRGDKIRGGDGKSGASLSLEALDEYLHPGYRVIEDDYRMHIYSLGV